MTQRVCVAADEMQNEKPTPQSQIKIKAKKSKPLTETETKWAISEEKSQNKTEELKTMGRVFEPGRDA